MPDSSAIPEPTKKILLILLESVGCFMDMESGNTYPANLDDTPDMSVCYHITDIESDEWFENLSVLDMRRIINYAKWGK